MEALPRETVELAKKHRFKSLKLVEVDLETELDPFPFGSVHGKLENGLTYYVRCNSKPQMRAALSLAVKVGSVFEEEHERGIAHIVEHLAFSATNKYTNHDLVKFLESIGAEFGACGNAYTSFDETVYELFVPIDKPGVLSEAISVLSEFSSEIRISPEDLDKERGAVLEEYRLGRDAHGRLAESCFAAVLPDSKYAERLPIGLENVIRKASAETAKGFYKKWYNLQSMAVIAVGDFPDTQSVVELIREHFGQKCSPEPPIIPRFKVPFGDETRYACFAEPEASGTTLEINWKLPNDEPETVGQYRDWLIGYMFRSALNRRFSILSRRKDPPYFGCFIGESELVRAVKAVEISASCKEKGPIEALKSVLIELARIRLHKFSEREIATARANIMSEMESAYLEREKIESTVWRYQYLQHFLRNEAVLGLECEAKLYKTILPQITAAEVSEYSERLRLSNSSVILVAEPRATVTLEELQGAVSEINKSEDDESIYAWEDDFIPEEIVQVKPNRGSIVHQSEYKDIGVTELVLSNGMKVCYKYTDFKNDQVIFKGYSYGGYSELLEGDFLSCLLSSSIAGEVGKFGYKPTVLVDILAGKRASVSTDLGAYTRSFIGDCSPSDFETALQLVYQLFVTHVKPEEEEDIKRVIHLVEELIHAEERDPQTAFSNKVTRIKYGNSYFYKPAQVSDLPKLDPEKACEYFDCCFKDPSTFIVVIVGNIDPSIAQPLILDYLGGIPKCSETTQHFSLDNIKGLPSNPPANIVREIVRSPMVEAQCLVHISLNIKLCGQTMMEEIWYVAFLTHLLQTKMTQALRFKHGEIYSVSVDSDFGYSKPSRTADLEGEITIDFSCDPNVSATLVDVALDEISNLQEQGPSEEDISTVLEIEQRTHENELQENVYWLFQILKSYRSRVYSGDLASSFQVLEKVRNRVRQSLSPLTAKWALRTILPYPCKGHFITVTLMPETNRLRLLKHQIKAQLKQKYNGRYTKTVNNMRRVFARKK